MSNIQVTQGTQTSIRTQTIAGNDYQAVILNLGSTADVAFTGTFLGGTLNAGTLTGGTLQNVVSGTVDTVGLVHANYWGTTVFTGTSTLGTIKPAVGAGTRIYVTDLIISVGSASNVVIGDGATSTPIAGTFFFAANGGMTSNNRTPFRTSQGGTLVFAQSAAIGSCTITAAGYTAP